MDECCHIDEKTGKECREQARWWIAGAEGEGATFACDSHADALSFDDPSRVHPHVQFAWPFRE